MEQEIRNYIKVYRMYSLVEWVLTWFFTFAGLAFLISQIMTVADMIFHFGLTARTLAFMFIWMPFFYGCIGCGKKIRHLWDLHDCAICFEKRKYIESNIFVNALLFMSEDDYAHNTLKQAAVQEAYLKQQSLPIYSKTEKNILCRQILKAVILGMLIISMQFSFIKHQTSFSRVLKPWKDLPAFSYDQLTGDFEHKTVLMGQDISFILRPGPLLAETTQKFLKFNYRFKESDKWEVLVIPADETQKFVVNRPYTVKPFDWFCEYGDFKSPVYTVTVLRPPKMNHFELKIMPPVLQDVNAKSIYNWGTVINFLAGSQMDLKFETDADIANVTLINQQDFSRLPLQQSKGLWHANWIQVQESKFDLEFEYEGGAKTEWDNILIFNQANNAPPKIKIEEPLAKFFHLEQERLELILDVSDDWGFSSIEILGQNEKGLFTSQLEWHVFNTPKIQYKGIYHIPYHKLSIVNDSITLRIIVRDVFSPDSKKQIMEETLILKRQKKYRSFKEPFMAFSKVSQKLFRAILNYIDDPVSDHNALQYKDSLQNFQTWVLNDSKYILHDDAVKFSILRHIEAEMEMANYSTQASKQVVFEKSAGGFKILCEWIWKVEINCLDIFMEALFQELSHTADISTLTDYNIFLQELKSHEWTAPGQDKITLQNKIIHFLEKNIPQDGSSTPMDELVKNAKKMYQSVLNQSQQQDFSAYLQAKLMAVHKRIQLLYAQANAMDVEKIKKGEVESWTELHQFWVQILNDSILQLQLLAEVNQQNEKIPGEIDLYTVKHQLNELDIWMREKNEYKALSKLKRVKELFLSFLNKTSAGEVISRQEENHSQEAMESFEEDIEILLPKSGDCYFYDAFLTLRLRTSNEAIKNGILLHYREEGAASKVLYIDSIQSENQNVYALNVSMMKFDISFKNAIEISVSLPDENKQIKENTEKSESVILYPFKMEKALNTQALMDLHSKFPVIWQRFREYLEKVLLDYNALESYVIKESKIPSETLNNFNTSKRNIIAAIFELDQSFQDIGFSRDDDPLVRFCKGIWKDWKQSFEEIWALLAMLEQDTDETLSPLEIILHVGKETQKWQRWLNEVTEMVSAYRAQDERITHSGQEQMTHIRQSLGELEQELKKMMTQNEIEPFDSIVSRFKSVEDEYAPQLDGMTDILLKHANERAPLEGDIRIALAMQGIRYGYTRIKDLVFQDLKDNHSDKLSYQSVYDVMSQLGEDSSMAKQVLLNPSDISSLVLTNLHTTLTHQSEITILPDESLLRTHERIELNSMKLDKFEASFDHLNTLQDDTQRQTLFKRLKELFIIMRLHVESFLHEVSKIDEVSRGKIETLRARLDTVGQRILDKEKKFTYAKELREEDLNVLKEKVQIFYGRMLLEKVPDAKDAFMIWQSSIKDYHQMVGQLLSEFNKADDLSLVSQNLKQSLASVLEAKSLWAILMKYTDREMFETIVSPLIGVALYIETQTYEYARSFLSRLVKSQSLMSEIAPKIQAWYYQFYRGIVDTQEWNRYEERFLELQGQLTEINQKLSDLNQRGLVQSEAIESLMSEKNKLEDAVVSLSHEKLQFFYKKEITVTAQLNEKKEMALKTHLGDQKMKDTVKDPPSQAVDLSQWILENLEDELNEIQQNIQVEDKSQSKLILFKEIAGFQNKDIEEVRHWFKQKHEKEHIEKSGKTLSELVGAMESAMKAHHEVESTNGAEEKITQFSKVRYLEHFKTQRENMTLMKEDLLLAHLSTDKMLIDVDSYFEALDDMTHSDSIDMNAVREILELEQQALKTMSSPGALSVHVFLKEPQDVKKSWFLMGNNTRNTSFPKSLQTWIQYYELSIAKDQ